MSSTDQAYIAGKEGRDWESVKQQYGDSYQNRSAYESGKTTRANNTGGSAVGSGFGGIMLLYLAFCVFSVIYIPFIAVAFLLIMPIWPDNINYKNGEFFFYAFIFIVLVYLVSCLFEYLRARMIEARAKNYTWKLYYRIIFAVRIVLPGIAVYFFILLNLDRLIFEVCLLSLIPAAAVVLLMAWKVKVLKPSSSLYFTGWAYKMGESSMETKPYLAKSDAIRPGKGQPHLQDDIIVKTET